MYIQYDSIFFPIVIYIQVNQLLKQEKKNSSMTRFSQSGIDWIVGSLWFAIALISNE